MFVYITSVYITSVYITSVYITSVYTENIISKLQTQALESSSWRINLVFSVVQDFSFYTTYGLESPPGHVSGSTIHSTGARIFSMAHNSDSSTVYELCLIYNVWVWFSSTAHEYHLISWKWVLGSSMAHRFECSTRHIRSRWTYDTKFSDLETVRSSFVPVSSMAFSFRSPPVEMNLKLCNDTWVWASS